MTMPTIDPAVDDFVAYAVTPYVSPAQREDERSVPLWKAWYVTQRGTSVWRTFTDEQSGWDWLGIEAWKLR